MIRCRAFGPVDIMVDGEPAPPELLWKKNLALLVYLARSPKSGRTRDHLMALLWGDRPESAARHSLREALRVVKKSLGDRAVSTDGDMVRIDPDAILLDAHELTEASTKGDWERAAVLFAGEFLEGFGVPDASEFENWLQAERTEWRRRGVNALVHRSLQLTDAGHAVEAATLAQRAFELEPGSDAGARAVIRALTIAGDRGAALESFDAFNHHLSKFGTRPDADTLALVERVRRERVWRLSDDVPRPGTPGAELRRAPLVGREDELGRLLEAMRAAAVDGHSTLLVIVADGGMGKTRLLEELASRARLAGVAASTMRCVSADQGDPMAGLLALARGGMLDAQGIGGAQPEALAALGRRLPEWADRFRVHGEGDLALPHALSDAMRAALDEQPLMLIVDDAQWIDDESARALGSMLRDLRATRLCIVAAMQPHPPRPDWDELRGRIGRDLDGVAVQLEPLSVDELRSLVAWALPDFTTDQRDRLARRLVADTAGLPLMAVEILHAVALGLDLGVIEGSWPAPLRTLEATLPGDLPDSLVAAVRTGFRRLSAPSQQVLCATAVAGGRATPEQLGRATGLSGGALDSALDEAEWQRWLQADPRGYAFVARVVGDVVERDMLTEGQRQRIRALLD